MVQDTVCGEGRRTDENVTERRTRGDSKSVQNIINAAEENEE